MDDQTTDFSALLRTLLESDVDLIVVGGVCAVLHGAPVSTFDLDVVHSRAPENLDRLIAALKKTDAYYRGRGEQRLRPTSSLLSSSGHHLLMTRWGPLDLLGTIGTGLGHEDLLKDTVEVEVDGMPLRILSLEALIRIKEGSTHPKDTAVLAILRRVLEERDKG